MNDRPSEKEQWERVKDLFSKAVELDGIARDQLIEKSTADDPLVAAEVRSLLKAHDHSDDVIENNALNLRSIFPDAHPDYVERLFGKYRILHEIGSGGMGSVFLAERDDGEFTMRVALKVMRQSIADAQTIARFKQERQILADLHHPNIAALIDGGIGENGEPFIAMEYIDGKPLLQYSADKKLDTHARLSLFLKVCSAVSYSHRHLVIHRDIKPSNILVTEDGEPKLLDFGMAKFFSAESESTQTQLRAFTPAYASPEQIAGLSVSTATDQFSLGVVLYEMLTGFKPFPVGDRSIDEHFRSMQTGSAIAPSAVSPQISHNRDVTDISRDLDTITLKALSFEPERRYVSVDAFADDISRHLNGLPITARPNTFAYIASRFIRRHRTPAIAAALVLLALISGVAATIWQSTIARRERDRAERRFEEVRQLSNSLLFDIAPKLERLPGSIEAREILVVKALEYLDGLATESGDEDALVSELARAYQKVGDIQGNPTAPNLSDFAGAIASYEKALALHERLPLTRANRDHLADLYFRLSQTRFAQNQTEAAIRDSERSTEILNGLIIEAPDDARFRIRLIEGNIDRARIYSLNNQYEIALPIYREMIRMLAEQDQNSVDVRRLTMYATAILGNSLSWNGQQVEAEIENEKAVAMAESLLADNGDDAKVQQASFASFTLASSTFETIKNDLSLKHARRAAEVVEKMVAADPADNQAKQNLARAHSRLGVVLILNGKQAEGFDYLRQAEASLEQLIAREPRNRVYQDDLGSLYTRLGDAEKNRRVLTAALREYLRAAETFRRITIDDPLNLVARRDLAQALKSVAVTEIKINKLNSASIHLNEAIAIYEDLKQKNAIGKWDEKVFDQMYDVRAKLDKQLIQ